MRVDEEVAWAAVAVSAQGGMTDPLPSKAVVGTTTDGVRKHKLVAKDVTSATSSAPLDDVQVMEGCGTALNILLPLHMISFTCMHRRHPRT